MTDLPLSSTGWKPPPPATRMAATMQYSEDDDGVGRYEVRYEVRKPSESGKPGRSIADLPDEWGTSDTAENIIQMSEKTRRSLRASLAVPSHDGSDVIGGVGPELERSHSSARSSRYNASHATSGSGEGWSNRSSST